MTPHPKKMNKKVKELVLARLETTFPDNEKLRFLSAGEFTKEQLIKEVKSETSIGIQYAEMEMKFLRALQKGADGLLQIRS